MSDYLFLMESRFSPEQWQAVLRMQSAAEAAGMNLYLAGGAIRDLVAGFPIDSLDFVAEGKALKMTRDLARGGIRILRQDEDRQMAELEFPSGSLVTVCMARSETFSKPGAPPRISPAGILADLRRRDFSINAIGVSLSANSRGLVLDPANGLGDLEKKEIRALYNTSFLDAPIRLLRAVRLRTRLHFTLEAKTAAHYQTAREQGVVENTSGEALASELRQIARERSPAEVLKALEKEGLLSAISPHLQGKGLDLPLIVKASKASQSLAEFGLRTPSFALFLYLLLRKLPPRDKAKLEKTLSLTKEENAAYHKLESDAKKLARDLSGKMANSPSKVYQILAAAPADLILLLQMDYPQAKIQSRLKAYLEKYLPLRWKLPEEELQQLGVTRENPRYKKILDAYFFSVLEGKLKAKGDQGKLLAKLVQTTK